MDNDEIIARGGGSWQARACNEDCPVCNGQGWYYTPNGPDDVDKEPCDCTMKDD